MNSHIPGKRFRIVRSDLQLNQSQMAKIIKVAKATLVSLERDGFTPAGDDEEVSTDTVIAANAILGLEGLIREAKRGFVTSANYISRTYERLGLSMRWVPGIGPIALGEEFSFLADGIAKAAANLLPSQESVQRIYQAFVKYDHDGNGSIDFQEFKNGLGWDSEEEAQKLFELLDHSKNGFLTLGELLYAPIEQPVWEVLNGKYSSLAEITPKPKE